MGTNLTVQPGRAHRTLAAQAGMDRLAGSINGQVADADLLGDDAADIEASWQVGVFAETKLKLLQDADGQPVFDGKLNPARLCGLPVAWTEGEDVRLNASRKPRPWVQIPTDRIEDAAATIRRAFPGERLEALVRALGGCDGGEG